MRDCVSHLELLRWEARPEAERSPDASDHLRTCARCAAALGGVGIGPPGAAGSRILMPRALSQLARSWLGWRNGAARHGGRFVVPLALTPGGCRSHAAALVTRGAPAPDTDRLWCCEARPPALCAPRAHCWSRRSASAVTVVFPVKDGDDFRGGRPPALRLHQGPKPACCWCSASTTLDGCFPTTAMTH